jgi:hypothetical protein
MKVTVLKETDSKPFLLNIIFIFPKRYDVTPHLLHYLLQRRRKMKSVENTKQTELWTLSIVRILIVTRKKKNKHDVSETGSVSVLR